MVLCYASSTPLLLLFLALYFNAPSLADGDRSDAFITYKEKGVGCRDLNTNCEDWFSKGECSKNPEYMKANCPVACKECTPAEVNAQEYIGEVLVLSSAAGDIRIRPYWDRAPRTAALALELAHQGHCQGCNFYRNEAVPQEGSGPPYGLLQGSLAGLLKVPPHEGDNIAMKRGHIAMIPNTKEFFINVMDHVDWGSSMTVWGEVEDLSVVEQMLLLAHHDVKHPSFGTVMRMLDSPVEFTPQYVPKAAAGSDAGAL